MGTMVFGKTYADQYDLLYGDKNYDAECDLIEEVVRRYAQGPVETILDLGCGTGNHAFPLAQRGYRVTGVERSAEMLAQATQKFQGDLPTSTSPLPTLIQGDVRSIELGQQYDVVLMMFAVLGYQLTNEDVLAALTNVRRHLRPGGLFICDVWYGPAVLTMRPSDRVKVIPTEKGRLIRAASGKLDLYRHLCEVNYHIWRLHGQQVISEIEEVHRMRYFFPQELDFFMSRVAMRIVDFRPFEDLSRLPGEDTWNVLVVAR